MGSPQALAYHNAQLQASAFREQYDPESFEDLTEPKLEMIHKVVDCLFALRIRHSDFCEKQRAGKLMKEWKMLLVNDESANVVVETTGSKRKAVGILQVGIIGKIAHIFAVLE